MADSTSPAPGSQARVTPLRGKARGRRGVGGGGGGGRRPVVSLQEEEDHERMPPVSPLVASEPQTPSTLPQQVA